MASRPSQVFRSVSILFPTTGPFFTARSVRRRLSTACLRANRNSVVEAAYATPPHACRAAAGLRLLAPCSGNALFFPLHPYDLTSSSTRITRRPDSWKLHPSIEKPLSRNKQEDDTFSKMGALQSRRGNVPSQTFFSLLSEVRNADKVRVVICGSNRVAGDGESRGRP